MTDDPYRMYIVIRRGAFTSLSEGGRMVGLAAVRATKQFELPDEWRRRAGKVVLRARQPSQFARLLEEPHASGGDGVIALPPRRRSERSETLTKIQAMSTELDPPPSSSSAPVVYAINPDVHMSTGKTLAQIAHAAVMADALGLDVSRARVIVPERWDAMDNCVAEVRDAGLTEVPPGTVTVRVLKSPPMRAFASDNYAPILPEALEAIAAANTGHAVSYGADEWTDQLRDRAEDVFGTRDIYPVFNGTGANVVGLRAMLRPWQGVVCAETAHLNVDEGGAPEVMGAIKLLTVATPDGKLTPELVDTRVIRIGDEHSVQPGVVSVTQSTELGTLYSVDELRALADHAHAHGMLFHIDGSRLANAAASLDVSLREVVEGADVVSFGGTKIGLLAAEAVVVLHPEIAPSLLYLRKQSMQLASKMRFISAQLLALLEGDLWRRSAGHANAMAARLADGVREVVQLTQPVQANGVFAILPPGAAEELQREFKFYVWNEHTGEVRWMCSWDTTEEDVDAFVAAVKNVVGAAVQ
ncbi:beta-eliminating lyase-related protein [Solirubrobacter sp. CPCC 204708]|uniref:Beta-eliminating lyase-related protein n=2 Tax=Solirubrobacter deserti TaxID=2282478 RepID=A0ABT4RIB2_9ACTN|nr:beta-eliminating lyase-related protein [Solirubrobacter deserti]MDA0138292.1 beta-eliminating lyase-related protein [Solirubrobacter deserti]